MYPRGSMTRQKFCLNLQVPSDIFFLTNNWMKIRFTVLNNTHCVYLFLPNKSDWLISVMLGCQEGGARWCKILHGDFQSPFRVLSPLIATWNWLTRIPVTQHAYFVLISCSFGQKPCNFLHTVSMWIWISQFPWFFFMDFLKVFVS